ncbi:adenylosuccinate lyase family protein [Brevibacterium picturae]|uniref:Lyase family protein n=1 Tax=Brevibacterium picturae TaxID=260553 RepID=A0ABP4LWT0_9MICO
MHNPFNAGVGPDSGILSPVRVNSPTESLVDDDAWVGAMVECEAALARAQAHLGSVPRVVADTITRVASEAHLDARKIAVASRQTANPVVGLIAEFTEMVKGADPEAAEYVHRGSTSQDILDTAAMLIAKRSFNQIAAELRATADLLESFANDHFNTLMAARTLGVHAVPTTFRSKVRGWRKLVMDALSRVEELTAGKLPVSLGGAAGTLAGYIEFARLANVPLASDPEAYVRALSGSFAREVGLAPSAPSWHALRTPIADIAAVACFVTGALGKIAVDIITLSRSEIGEVAEPGGEGHGASSAMPHKRNPAGAAMIRSAALQVPAFATVLQAGMLAADERDAGTWHAEWLPFREILRLAGGASYTTLHLLEGLQVYPERMQANLDSSSSIMLTERLAIELTKTLGKQEARSLVTRLSSRSRDSNRVLLDVVREDATVMQTISDDRLTALFDPHTYLGVADR